MELVKPSDPILRQECKPFDFTNPQLEITSFAHELVRFMYEKNGLGLAANQVGVNLRVFALRASPQNFVCINPRIVWFSEETILLEEGCLTFPNLLVKIKRPSFIRVRFFTPNGETRTEKFVGMTARCFQHEMDHINGILFYDKSNRYHKEQAFKKKVKLDKEEFIKERMKS